ncbi:MAG: asparagine synthase-related protein [Anaerolineae bacterium]|jgi:asparagine synthase (glutamine-hydrolysing)
MSGILGLLNLDGAPLDGALLWRLTETMAFRGPDALDTWSQGSVGLGQALLRTTFEADRERGPCSLDGQVWIAADARVDGREELIRKLRGRGRDPAGEATDPELILHAYHAWSDDCLDHLIGDWAFILWDGLRRRFLCARDQFGVVPLYYARVRRGEGLGQVLILSNTLQAVLCHPGVSDELNEQAIGDYLLFRNNRDLHTSTFADVRRLPPAHALTCSAEEGTLRLRRYWTPPAEGEYLRYQNPEDYVARFQQLFRQAVADRLRTGRLAVALSGGMDSAAVAAVAHQVLDAREQPFQLSAFTFTHTLVPYEEDHHAELVAQMQGIPLHRIDSDARLLDHAHQAALPGHSGALSPEPAFVFAGWLNPWDALWDRAAAGRVLLTGHGGDPALRSSQTYWLDLLKRGQLKQAAADLRQYRRLYGHRPPLYLRANLVRRLARAPSPRAYPVWLNPDFAARLDLPDRLGEEAGAWAGHDGLESMALNPYWTNFLASFDPGNTCRPLKARFPFFDLRLVAYLAVVPPVPWFEDKRLLRRATRHLLPEEIWQRPKTLRGGLPLEALARQQGVPPYLEDLATAPELAPYVDGDALLDVVRAPGAENGLFKSLLRPIALAYWLRHRPRFTTPGGQMLERR